MEVVFMSYRQNYGIGAGFAVQYTAFSNPMWKSPTPLPANYNPIIIYLGTFASLKSDLKQ
jgi:hypothetical protein